MRSSNGVNLSSHAPTRDHRAGAQVRLLDLGAVEERAVRRSSGRAPGSPWRRARSRSARATRSRRASTRSFSGALPTRNTSPAITNSVPRCAPLITTSLHRRRLTVAGVASRRIRVPVKCSIAKIVPSIACVASPRVVWSHQREYRSAQCSVRSGDLRARSASSAPSPGWAPIAGAPSPRSRSPQPAPAKPSDAPLPSCLDQTIRDQLGERAQAARRPEARLPQEQEDRPRRARRPVRRRPDVVELDRRRLARLLLHRGPRHRRPSSTSRR